MGEIVPFPKREQTREDLQRLAAEAEIQIEDATRALENAKARRMYYLRKLGMVAMGDGEE